VREEGRERRERVEREKYSSLCQTSRNTLLSALLTHKWEEEEEEAAASKLLREGWQEKQSKRTESVQCMSEGCVKESG
jgi:hypothetical protein